MAKTAQTGVTVDDVDLLADHDVSEYGEEGEDGREGGGAVDDGEGDMVDLDAVRKISDPFPVGVRMRYDDDLVAPIDQFRRKLVDVAFDPSWLREEEVANHSNVVSKARHLEGRDRSQLYMRQAYIAPRRAEAVFVYIGSLNFTWAQVARGRRNRAAARKQDVVVALVLVQTRPYL